MKKYYECSFSLWEEFREGGKLDAKPTASRGIWCVTEKSSGEFGFVFCDETENFYPKIFPTITDAIVGRRVYCETELNF